MKNSKISKMSALSLAVLSALSMSVYAADVSQGGGHAGEDERCRRHGYENRSRSQSCTAGC